MNGLAYFMERFNTFKEIQHSDYDISKQLGITEEEFNSWLEDINLMPEEKIDLFCKLTKTEKYYIKLNDIEIPQNFMFRNRAELEAFIIVSNYELHKAAVRRREKEKAKMRNRGRV